MCLLSFHYFLSVHYVQSAGQSVKRCSIGLDLLSVEVVDVVGLGVERLYDAVDGCRAANCPVAELRLPCRILPHVAAEAVKVHGACQVVELVLDPHVCPGWYCILDEGTDKRYSSLPYVRGSLCEAANFVEPLGVVGCCLGGPQQVRNSCLGTIHGSKVYGPVGSSPELKEHAVFTELFLQLLLADWERTA